MHLTAVFLAIFRRTLSSMEVYPYSADVLCEALANDFLLAGQVSQRPRVLYLDEYLKHLGAKSMVVEADYVDGDYLEDYASFYVRCFTGYRRRCRRLHFFSVPLEEEDLLKYVEGREESGPASRLGSSYLGFVVARPLPDAIIGRTLLATYESDKGRRHYPAVREWTANLFGVDLSIMSLPFQEQDTVLAACATVALWSCFHKTSQLFGTSAPRPAEITRIANRVVNQGRPIPSKGLNLEQMCAAIRSVGLDPELVEVTPQTPLGSLLYGHLRMGLPAILVVQIGSDFHAVAVTGYSVRDKATGVPEIGITGVSTPTMVGSRIDEFYGHDDQVGPFARLKVRPPSSGSGCPIEFESSWKSGGAPIPLLPRAVVFPVYHKIRVTFLDVVAWLSRLHALFSSLLSNPEEWDLFLMTTNDYKRSLPEEISDHAVVGQIRVIQHPRFIWRATLSLSEERMLEILFDATDMARSFPFYAAIWHSNDFHNFVDQLTQLGQIQPALEDMLTPQLVSFLRHQQGAHFHPTNP